MKVSLNDMKSGQSGTLVAIRGDHGIKKRLDAMGLRNSKQIKKVSSMLMRGPVVVTVDDFQVAIGYRMASKIVVEIE